MTCYACGFTAIDSRLFLDCDGEMLCLSCARDYRQDHPDREEKVAEAEYRADCKEDR